MVPAGSIRRHCRIPRWSSPAKEHLDLYRQLLTNGIHVLDRAREILQRAGQNADFLADGDAEFHAVFLRGKHYLHLFRGQGNRLAVGTHKARNAAGVAHQIPAFTGLDHAHQHVARIHFALRLDALVALDLHHVLHGDADVEDQVFHAVVLNRLFDIILDLVLVAGIGMYHIPARFFAVFGHGVTP